MPIDADKIAHEMWNHKSFPRDFCPICKKEKEIMSEDINKSGWRAAKGVAIIKLNEAIDKIGNVYVPEHLKKDTYFQGLLVDINYEEENNNVRLDKNPSVGDIVVFEAKAGNIVKGADGKEYRLVKIEEILAFQTV